MPGATASRGSAAAPAVASSGFHRGITLRSGASSLSSFSMRLAVVAIMAERLTILVTCLVVFGNNAIVVPGLYQSGSKLIDEWNLFPRHPGCYPIHRKYGAMCSVFSYNTTRSSGAVGFNFLHHQRQKEAFDQLKTYQPLINAGCSRDLRFLLCSFHFPVCSEHLMEPITPCRSLCERVQNDCGAVLAREGVQWPETINCSYLLEESRLGGGERMHVCVSHTTELDQATRATPIEREVVRPPGKAICLKCLKFHNFVIYGGAMPFKTVLSCRVCSMIGRLPACSRVAWLSLYGAHPTICRKMIGINVL